MGKKGSGYKIILFFLPNDLELFAAIDGGYTQAAVVLKGKMNNGIILF